MGQKSSFGIVDKIKRQKRRQQQIAFVDRIVKVSMDEFYGCINSEQVTTFWTTTAHQQQKQQIASSLAHTKWVSEQEKFGGVSKETGSFTSKWIDKAKSMLLALDRNDCALHVTCTSTRWMFFLLIWENTTSKWRHRIYDSIVSSSTMLSSYRWKQMRVNPSAQMHRWQNITSRKPTISTKNKNN